jgi:transposase InsO family protein
VLSWRLSNTLDGSFCVSALEEALARFGKPAIFNTDQGCQFTAAAFTGTLAAAGVRISMDGRGRWMDNVFNDWCTLSSGNNRSDPGAGHCVFASSWRRLRALGLPRLQAQCLQQTEYPLDPRIHCIRDLRAGCGSSSRWPSLPS